jgi:hypothetical protein
MKIEQLITIIETVFDGVPQPTQRTLHDAEAWDNYSQCSEEDRKKDDIRRWQNLPMAHVEECQYALPHLDKTGLRFYLPAYMTWYLKSPNATGWWVDSTLYSFDNYPNNPELSIHHKERFSLFTKDQLAACALFVKYCISDMINSDTSFALKIYDEYWSQYV